MDQNLEILKVMKKSKLKSLLDKLIKESALKELSKIKENHSKVKHIKHEKFEMQNYFKSYELKMTQDEMQEIFKLRCRVTEVKANFKNKYENVECDQCKEEESQKHVIMCEELNKYGGKIDEYEIKYEEIFQQNVKKQLNITKKFRENMKIRKQLAN